MFNAITILSQTLFNRTLDILLKVVISDKFRHFITKSTLAASLQATGDVIIKAQLHNPEVLMSNSHKTQKNGQFFCES